jgi:CubicO group peptidase (beta-lactamase class C family)
VVPYASTPGSTQIVNDWLAWSGAIQVKHLLSHTAGFINSGDTYGASVMFGVDENLLTYSQIHRFILAARPLLFAPGTTSRYSNHGFGVAGHVLELASGQSFESYLRTNILDPSNLDQIVRSGTGDQALQASPHVKVDGHLEPIALETTLPTELAAGGWSATAGDMVRLMLSTDQLPNHPDILSPGSLNEMETPPFPNTAGDEAIGWKTNAGGKLAKGGDLGDEGNAYIAKFPAGYTVNGVDVGGMTIALCSNGGGDSSLLKTLADDIVKAAAPIAVDPAYDLY